MNEAVGIFERSSRTPGNGDENLGILMAFRHAIEMLDGVEVLLDASCVVASHPPLRSAFEASLTVRYVLANDIERRALSYVVGDIYEQLYGTINRIQKLIAASDSGMIWALKKARSSLCPMWRSYGGLLSQGGQF